MRSFSFDLFYLANPQSFCFFHFVRLTEKPKITLRHALGIPHSFSVFPSISNPFISLCFRPFQAISALRFASALANVNEEKEGEKEKISHISPHERYIKQGSKVEKLVKLIPTSSFSR